VAGYYKENNEISNAKKKENVAAEQLKRLHIPVLLQPKTSIFVVWGITMCNMADK